MSRVYETIRTSNFLWTQNFYRCVCNPTVQKCGKFILTQMFTTNCCFMSDVTLTITMCAGLDSPNPDSSRFRFVPADHPQSRSFLCCVRNSGEVRSDATQNSKKKEATPAVVPFLKRRSDLATKKRWQYQWQTSLKDFRAS
jgi:hypothetical protein